MGSAIIRANGPLKFYKGEQGFGYIEHVDGDVRITKAVAGAFEAKLDKGAWVDFSFAHQPFRGRSVATAIRVHGVKPPAPKPTIEAVVEVTRFLVDKGFGFVDVTGLGLSTDAAFLRMAVCEQAGLVPSDGDIVKAMIVEEERGPLVTSFVTNEELQQLDPSTLPLRVSSEVAEESEAFEPISAPTSAVGELIREKVSGKPSRKQRLKAGATAVGYFKSFEVRGYGFLRVVGDNEGVEDVFFHISDVDPSVQMPLQTTPDVLYSFVVKERERKGQLRLGAFITGRHQPPEELQPEPAVVNDPDDQAPQATADAVELRPKVESPPEDAVAPVKKSRRTKSATAADKPPPKVAAKKPARAKVEKTKAPRPAPSIVAPVTQTPKRTLSCLADLGPALGLPAAAEAHAEAVPA